MVMKVGETYPSNNYGDMEVIEYVNSKSIQVRFVATGYSRYATAGDIRKGEVKDPMLPSVQGVGYLGVGPYSSSTDNKKSACYNTWNAMLARCYNPSTQKNHPSYAGCTVVSEWHCFQNFAIWYDKYYVQGYELDKDTKVVGNKVYGPDTCTFLPQAVNVSIATSKKYSVLFKGERVVVHNLSAFCRDNNLRYPNVLYATTKAKKVVDVSKYVM